MNRIPDPNDPMSADARALKLAIMSGQRRRACARVFFHLRGQEGAAA